jgi:hypothetical protein
MNLFSLYIFIEIGGTGGGCFRYMYSRFLEESSLITKNRKLLGPAEKIRRSGEILTETGLLFKDSETAGDINERIRIASSNFETIHKIESDAWKELSAIV